MFDEGEVFVLECVKSFRVTVCVPRMEEEG